MMAGFRNLFRFQEESASVLLAIVKKSVCTQLFVHSSKIVKLQQNRRFIKEKSSRLIAHASSHTKASIYSMKYYVEAEVTSH